jgi:hypothetical protein
MNLSIKAAKQLGERIARSLHLAGTDTAKRGAIVDLKNDIPNSSTRIAFEDAYRATLDILEPLPSSKKVAP